MTAAEVGRRAAVPWRGRWVADALDLTFDSDPGSLLPVTDLVGLALRRNPRRAHLLVSTVLGKHLPADPRLVYGAGRLLGLLAADRLAGAAPSAAVTTGAALLAEALHTPDPAAGQLIELCDGCRPDTPAADGTLVLGYAETATALGHCVAESLAADYLHSTRRQVPGFELVAGFDEEHSHASRHLLLPADPGLLAGAGPLVLVDDELSTGRTALNTIAALHRTWPRPRYLIATLVDLRPAEDRARLQQLAAELGVPIDVVALASGQLRVSEQALATGRLLAEREPADPPIPGRAAAPAPVLTGWPAGLAEGGRHGFPGTAHAALGQAAAGLAATLAGRLRNRRGCAAGERRILVLGCEELMYAPLRIAVALADELAGEASVRFSSTTRSPVLPVDDPGYAIRTRLCFASMDDPADGPGPRWAYNVAATEPAERFSDIVLVTDTGFDGHTGPDGSDGIVGQLRSATGHLQTVRLPAYRPAKPFPAGGNAAELPEPLTGPAFGSYPAADVRWLLTDLSGVELEAPIEEREEAIQSGAAHYAESLPQEYQPSAEYRRLFADALAASADRLAHAVGVVTELVLDQRGPGVVLASLARAGTPVGVLMRRWAAYAHGTDLPHYSVSIVRGRGIDELALAYLARRHGPAAVQFVDGWTGKGAITGELAAAVAQLNRAWWPAGGGFSAELAVLADPGSCVSVYGSRADYLIPSACLNSTVSGLVSRTVLRADLIGPHRFHGAKFYAELAADDVSMRFVDTVADRFAAVAEAVRRDWPVLRDSDRRPTWAGAATVEELSQRYGIGDTHLVKPGVGETTRVLLLAAQRGVPVEEVDGLAFSCVGLIAPRRDDTGAGR